MRGTGRGAGMKETMGKGQEGGDRMRGTGRGTVMKETIRNVQEGEY
jgi:hypothetical protein